MFKLSFCFLVHVSMSFSRNCPYPPMSTFQNQNHSDFQVKFADGGCLPEIFRGPHGYPDWYSPFDIRFLKISDPLDIRYPSYEGTDNFWKNPIVTSFRRPKDIQNT